MFFYDTKKTPSFSEEVFNNFEFCVHCCGDWRVDINGRNVYYKINRYEGAFPRWYKLQKHDDKLHIYYSCEGKNWVIIDSIVLDFLGKNANMGFHIHLYENQYQKWICNNFIQIRFDKNAGKPIDYVGLMNRDWKNYSINPLVKFSYDKHKMIKQRGLWNYIVDNICNDRFLEIWLDEYFIEGLTAYKKHTFVHESLIFGFDDEVKKVSLISFIEGKPVFIDAVEKAWENAYDNNHTIQTFEFSPDGIGYNIEIKHICKQLQDYLVGRNSTEDYKYIAQEDRGIFGHKIYSEILSNNDNRKIFLNDLRIAFLMKEHKECMLFRMEFLYEYGVFDEKEYPYLLELMKCIVNYANIIMNLVIKNKLLNTDKIQERIWKYMSKLCVLEENCYQALINELKKYLEKR